MMTVAPQAEPPRARGPADARVLEIVGALVGELRGSGLPVAVSLDDSLERDLGISSLERVELLLRLERDLGVRLPDAAVAEAETPADLVRSLLRAAPAAPEPAPSVRAPTGAAAPAPARAPTLVDALRWHVEATPDRVHVFLREEAGGERPITYRQLWESAAEVAAALSERGIERGERVALMLRTEEAFFRVFFGILLAGAVPVPIYPPFRADRIEEYAHRQAGILRNAGAALLITFAQAERVGSILRGHLPTLRAVVPIDRLRSQGRRRPPMPRATGGDPALIQYTSGSTGDSKGVLLTHANVLANLRAIGQAIDIRPDDVGVSWLPLYHDMGLIGTWLGALYFGVPVVLLSPVAFLARPSRWLWAIHAHRGTVSPAPNFAFDLCTRRIADAEIEGLDLSAWRLALNGSEAVSPETIEGFTRRFARYGFQAEAMYPVYGLAEASVGLTMPLVGRPPRIDCLRREPFERRREIRPAGPDDQLPLRFVSCGRPLPGHDVRIVDGTGRSLGERTEGRIQFRGPSAAHAYFRNPNATRAVFTGDWVDAGDLGYWAGGELFITGRAKDVVIRGGRNIAPEEAEAVAGAVAGVRRGCVAAFGVHDPAVGTERLVIVAETREIDPVRQERLRADVTARVTEALGVPPDHVLIVPPGAVLKTPSGKIRRGATRDVYVDGTLLARRPSVAFQWIRLVVDAAATRARYVMHLAGRALLTGYAVLLLVLTLPALWGVLRLVAPGRVADGLVKRWSRLALALTRFTPSVAGAEHLARAGPAMLVANHASYIDSVVLMAVLPPDVRFVAKQALTSYPIIGTVIRRAEHVTIEKADLSRRLAGADQIARALGVGISLLVFPEGTFLRPPGILPFRLGAFRAAVDTGRPIVPIALGGTRDVLPSGAWLLRHGPIAVTIGPPLVPEATGWPEMVRLRDLARAAIARHTGEPVISHHDSGGGAPSAAASPSSRP